MNHHVCERKIFESHQVFRIKIFIGELEISILKQELTLF